MSVRYFYLVNREWLGGKKIIIDAYRGICHVDIDLICDGISQMEKFPCVLADAVRIAFKRDFIDAPYFESTEELNVVPRKTEKMLLLSGKTIEL